MNYWLLKTEGSCYSIDHFKKDKKTQWTGVRNYQARNFMINDMKVGDSVFFYHSNSDPTGIAGLARVCALAHPDKTAMDSKDEHYDPKATAGKPIWFAVDVEFVKKFGRIITLAELKKEEELDGMLLLKRGTRLSVQPVTKKQFEKIMRWQL